MTNNKNVILSAQDIVVEFDVRDKILTAIRGVSLELIEGEVLALVGESGSGKSVLTKTFTGMLEDNGKVVLILQGFKQINNLCLNSYVKGSCRFITD